KCLKRSRCCAADVLSGRSANSLELKNRKAMTWATSCRWVTFLISTCCGATPEVHAMNSQKRPNQETVPEGGEVMLLTFQQSGLRWRPLIYVGPPEEPNKASELCV